jgi:hypothetical protein
LADWVRDWVRDWVPDRVASQLPEITAILTLMLEKKLMAGMHGQLARLCQMSQHLPTKRALAER